MRELHLKGLTPATAELVRPLLAWPDIQARWRGEMDTAAVIRRIDRSGEVSAIPFLLTYALAQNREVQTTARAAIERLYRLMTALELLPFDEALRTSWAHVEDWYGQKLPVRKLRPDESQDLIMLGLMCSHRIVH